MKSFEELYVVVALGASVEVDVLYESYQEAKSAMEREVLPPKFWKIVTLREYQELFADEVCRRNETEDGWD